jgi:hypothetical protein
MTAAAQSVRHVVLPFAAIGQADPVIGERINPHVAPLDATVGGCDRGSRLCPGDSPTTSNGVTKTEINPPTIESELPD